VFIPTTAKYFDKNIYDHTSSLLHISASLVIFREIFDKKYIFGHVQGGIRKTVPP
jgi:hypothetical protein